MFSTKRRRSSTEFQRLGEQAHATLYKKNSEGKWRESLSGIAMTTRLKKVDAKCLKAEGAHLKQSRTCPSLKPASQMNKIDIARKARCFLKTVSASEIYRSQI